MCFNLIGGTAPDWIPHIFTRENIGGGLTSRIMYAGVRTPVGWFIWMRHKWAIEGRREKRSVLRARAKRR